MTVEEENKRLKAFIRGKYYKHTGAPFICGEGGEKDSMGLPEYFLICPTFGAGVGCTTMYRKV